MVASLRDWPADGVIFEKLRSLHELDLLCIGCPRTADDVSYPARVFCESVQPMRYILPCALYYWQVRVASDRYISGCYDAQGEEDDSDGDSDVICLDAEDTAESERRKLAMSPRAPATENVYAKKENSEVEESEDKDSEDENKRNSGDSD